MRRFGHLEKKSCHPRFSLNWTFVEVGHRFPANDSQLVSKEVHDVHLFRCDVMEGNCRFRAATISVIRRIKLRPVQDTFLTVTISAVKRLGREHKLIITVFLTSDIFSVDFAALLMLYEQQSNCTVILPLWWVFSGLGRLRFDAGFEVLICRVLICQSASREHTRVNLTVIFGANS